MKNTPSAIRSRLTAHAVLLNEIEGLDTAVSDLTAEREKHEAKRRDLIDGPGEAVKVGKAIAELDATLSVVNARLGKAEAARATKQGPAIAALCDRAAGEHQALSTLEAAREKAVMESRAAKLEALVREWKPSFSWNPGSASMYSGLLAGTGEGGATPALPEREWNLEHVRLFFATAEARLALLEEPTAAA